MKRILFSIPFNPTGIGAGPKNFTNFFSYLEPLFIENGYEIVVCPFLPKDENIDTVANQLKANPIYRRSKIIPVKRKFPSGNPVFQLLELIVSTFRFKKVVKAQHPDLVFAYGERNAYFSAVWKKKSGYKLIQDVRGDILSEYKIQGMSAWKISVTGYIMKKAIRN